MQHVLLGRNQPCNLGGCSDGLLSLAAALKHHRTQRASQSEVGVFLEQRVDALQRSFQLTAVDRVIHRAQLAFKLRLLRSHAPHGGSVYASKRGHPCVGGDDVRPAVPATLLNLAAGGGGWPTATTHVTAPVNQPSRILSAELTALCCANGDTGLSLVSLLAAGVRGKRSCVSHNRCVANNSAAGSRCGSHCRVLRCPGACCDAGATWKFFSEHNSVCGHSRRQQSVARRRSH